MKKIHRQTTTAANVFMDFLTNLYSRKSQHTCVKLLNFIHFICSALALRICIEQSFKHVLDEHYYVSVRRHHNFVCCQWLSCTLLTHRVELFVSILHHVVARASAISTSAARPTDHRLTPVSTSTGRRMQVECEKNRDLSPISCFISKIIQDRTIVNMEREYELVRDLSNSAILTSLSDS